MQQAEATRKNQQKKRDELCSLNLDRLFDANVDKTFGDALGTGNEFEDQSFPADESSLFWPSKAEGGGVFAELKTKVDHWERPRAAMEGSAVGPDLWGTGGIQPTAAKQGALADNWLLASAAALAEKPEWIKDAIVNDAYSKEGIFEFQFYVKGEPVKLVIDDLLPVGPGGSPVNARAASDGAQWLVLLEKAFAKLYINYANLAGGQPAEALRAMTGMPVAMYNTGNLSDAKLFKSIQEAEQKGYVMLATCENPVRNLEPGHSYTILSALELKADNGKVARLIKMRNPWSTETYEGPWSLDDETWTPEMKS